MKSVLLGVLAVAMVWSAGACRDPFAPDQSVILYVSEMDAPSSVASGTPITAVLTVLTGGCVGFDHIETRKDASGASVTVWGRDGRIGNENIPCTADLRTETHAVSFDPPFARTFEISVNRRTEDPLTATVEVL